MDSGYDVSDYYKVDSIYGTNQDFYLLLEKARPLKIIIDLVMNHTSSEHKWFKKALQGDSKYLAYYYFFKDTGKTDTGKPDGTPLVIPTFRDKKEILIPGWNDRGLNDNVYSKSHPYTSVKIHNEKYYYLHTFSDFQPDLNGNNRIVQEEMIPIANYGIGKGVKGFRFDAIPLIGKDIRKPLTVPNFEKLDEYLSEFKSGTYKEINDFLTIGELSQQEGKASQHKVS